MPFTTLTDEKEKELYRLQRLYWREALRWELWIGLILQALIIGAWVWSVYAGPQGTDHLLVKMIIGRRFRFITPRVPRILKPSPAGGGE